MQRILDAHNGIFTFRTWQGHLQAVFPDRLLLQLPTSHSLYSEAWSLQRSVGSTAKQGKNSLGCEHWQYTCEDADMRGSECCQCMNQGARDKASNDEALYGRVAYMGLFGAAHTVRGPKARSL